MELSLFNHLVSVRRELHQHPEIGYQEYQTASVVCRELDKLQIPYFKEIAKTGVIASLKKGEGPCIALRADMDALPLNEETDLDFKSKIPNMMHACGHDVHTTMLIGAANLLIKENFAGTIKFIFQPSEEGNYDDIEKKSGGQRIAETELADVTAAVGLHVHPLLPVGKIGFTLGEAMACTNFFRISVLGKAGHAGAAHHLAIDSIFVAGSLIQAVQSIVSRYTAATKPVVISFTKVNGGVAPNIIADKVILEGTIRAFDFNTYEEVKRRLEKISNGIAEAYGANIQVEYLLDYPGLLNDEKIHEKLNGALTSVFEKENVIKIDPVLAGEDFAFYSRKIPSMFYFIGANYDSQPYFVHHPKVVINEDVIKYGSEFLASAALALL